MILLEERQFKMLLEVLVASTQDATHLDSDIIESKEVHFHLYINTPLITYAGSKPVLGDEAICAQPCFRQQQYFQPPAT